MGMCVSTSPTAAIVISMVGSVVVVVEVGSRVVSVVVVCEGGRVVVTITVGGTVTVACESSVAVGLRVVGRPEDQRRAESDHRDGGSDSFERVSHRHYLT